jgi:hypothetical protein
MQSQLDEEKEEEAMTLLNKAFLIDAGERAVRTFCQSALGAGIVGATDLMAVDWVGALSVGGLAAVISVLTSLASEPRGDTLSPASAVKEP